MVKKIFALLHKESNGIHDAALLMGIFTLLSQVLALVRDRSLAHFLGPSANLDIYYAAFRVPDFLYVSIASLVSITVLIPFLIKRMRSDTNDHTGKEEGKKFLNQVFTVFFVAMIVLSIIVGILMPYIAHFIAPGFNAQEIAKLIVTSRIMLLSPLFIGISNVLGSITQYYKNFFVYSLSPVFYNIGIIVGVLFLFPIFGVYGLAYGVILGALLHFSIQLPVIIKHGFIPRFTKKINWKEIRSVTAISLPRTLALSLNSITLIVIVALASLIKEGSISIFTFAYNLNTVPLNIIGTSYSIAAFPILAEAYAVGNIKRYIDYTMITARQMIFWSLPIMVLFIVIRAQIVRVILGSGAFSWSSTRLTAATLALFAISIVAQGLVLLFVRAYYAAGKTRQPLTVNIIASVITIVLAYVLLHAYNTSLATQSFFKTLLRVDSIGGSAILMLALAYSIGSIFNFFAHWILFRRDFMKEYPPALARTFYQSLAAAIFLGVTSYGALAILGPIFGLSTFWGVFGQGLLAGILGILAAVGVLKLLKNQEMENVWKSLHHKIWGAKVFSPGPEDLQ